MTKGIILSGGWGTRLRPLTCTIPKTLIPVGNKPVIERQMLLLKSAGVKEIILAVSVMADALKRYFKDGRRLGLDIKYTNEKSPLGTAGAIKLAEDHVEDDNFFMLNGDVILNFDFKEMLMTHNRYKGIGTIASKIVDNPSRYGVLITDEETHNIKKFLEKSEYKAPIDRKVAMPVNAGVYILEPEIFSYIPPYKKYSIEIDVFPKLANENKLYHFPISGIWKDIGQPHELLEGNILLLKDILKKLGGNRENLIESNVSIDRRSLIFPPVMLGSNVIIKKDCIIGPNVIIGDNVYIGENTQIKDTLIYKETYVSKNVKIEKAIISDNCNIEDNVVLQGENKKLVILSSCVEILKNVRVIVTDFPISICHHEVVKESRTY
ncbi:MAG: sugar phosphate nucleotidyltransferase [Promethearchaeota archaeon]